MDVLKDERFSDIVKDPRFKKVPAKHTKTKIDKRFHGLFSDNAFGLKHKVDKRGAPVGHKKSEDYQKFYQFDEQDESVKEETDSSDDGDDEHKKKSSDEESDSEAEDEKTGFDPRQFEGSSDEDNTTDGEVFIEKDGKIDHCWQELDADAPRTTDISRRLAVCNMDWDRLRAEDFLVVFNSFKPPDGVIYSIKIYPSEYGLKCIEKEKLYGPAALIEENEEEEDEEEEDDDGASSSGEKPDPVQEKLRKYQINRLKYYFAVVDCDSPETADALYGHLNGMEFENSGCILDLRFIPDDMTFEQEPVGVTNSLSAPEDYRPLSFVTSALNQINFDVTWDMTDPRRKMMIEKAFIDPESVEKDLKEYLASPSESEDEMEESEDTANNKRLSTKEAIAKYRELLRTLEEKEQEKEKVEEEFDLEITWEPGLKEKTEKLVKDKILKENLTPFEEKLQKQKELKKRRKEKRQNPEKVDNSSSEDSGPEQSDHWKNKKSTSKGHKKKNKFKSQEDSEEEKKIAELALLMADPDDKNLSDSDDASPKNRKKKMKKKKDKKNIEAEEDPVEFIDDPRFAALYTNPLFHIDPSYQNVKEGKKLQSFNEMIQRKKKCRDSNPIVVPHAETENDFTEGLKDKAQESIKVENIKKKVGEFFKEFENKKKLKSPEKQRTGLKHKKGHSVFMTDSSVDFSVDATHPVKRKKWGSSEEQDFSVEGHSTHMSRTSPGTVSEVNSPKSRKKKKKVKKEGYPMVDDDQVSSNNVTQLSVSAASAAGIEENDDPDISIFSSGSRKKQASAFSLETSHHMNSVRKKMKKCNM